MRRVRLTNHPQRSAGPFPRAPAAILQRQIHSDQPSPPESGYRSTTRSDVAAAAVTLPIR